MTTTTIKFTSIYIATYISHNETNELQYYLFSELSRIHARIDLMCSSHQTNATKKKRRVFTLHET